MDTDISNEDLRYVAENIFLPPKLPLQEEPDLRRKDAVLVKLVEDASTAFVRTLHQSYGGITDTTKLAWEAISKMIQTMHNIHSTDSLSGSRLIDALQHMKVDDVTPVYISGQNAGIIFRKLSADRLTFESFEVSLPNEVITSTRGKVLVTYPSNPRILVAVESEMIEPLADMLSFLDTAHIGDVVPLVPKASAEHEDIRNTASPRYITEATFGFLRGIAPSDESIKTKFIQKKIDDHVLFDSADKPWRRSPLWLLVRVAMQSTLEERGITGAEGYKAFQSFLMAQVLSVALKRVDAITDDILHIMNAKLARRLRKMKDLVDGREMPTIKFAADTVLNVASVLEKRWKDRCFACVNQIDWHPPTEEIIQTSLKFTLKRNQEYLRSVVMRTPALAQSTSSHDDEETKARLRSGCSHRLPIDNSYLPGKINAAELDISLYDFEAWVEHKLPQWSADRSRTSLDCQDLADIIRSYHSLAISHYRNSPERISLMWLTLIELWVALDKITTSWCPLLKEYSPDISAETLDSLLLPYAAQLHRLEIIQSYLHHRHEIAESVSVFTDPGSFANNYFLECPSLQAQKEQIIDWGRQEKEKKLKEREDLNKSYYNLINQASKLTCAYWMHYGRRYDLCRKCNLENQAQSLTITRFEEPLPDDIDEANFIVFELNCPTPYGLWRDITYELILGTFPPAEDVQDKLYKLQTYEPLNRFYHAQGFRVAAASVKASFHSMYLGKPHRLPAEIRDVIQPHAGKFQLFDASKQRWLRDMRHGQNLQSSCTFQLEGAYQSMQPFIQSTSHSPNSVITSQFNCPKELLTSEFVSFGLLRSGHRLQLRNIMRTLSNNSLTLSDGNVLSLVLQSIWQAGPNTNSTVNRDAHCELVYPGFVIDMIEVLKACLQRLGDNESQAFFLAALVALASRLLSLATDPDYKHSARQLLVGFRSLGLKWIAKAVAEPSPVSSDDTSQYRHRLLKLALVCRSTFDVEQEELENALQSNESVEDLLYLTLRLARVTTSSGTNASIIQLLLRRDRRLTYRLEPFLMAKLRQNPSILNIVKKILPSYSNGSPWTPLQSPASRWWYCKTSSEGLRRRQGVFVNIVDGTVLLDGKPEGRLPDEYVVHASWKSLFGTSISLPSQPSDMKGMEYQIQYLEEMIHVAMIDDELVIRLLRDNSIEEFVPSGRLRHDLPDSFLQSHHVWYVEKDENQWLEFRPQHNPWAQTDKNVLRLYINPRSGTLLGAFQRRSSSGILRAVDPHSQLYKSVHSILKALEPSSVGMELFTTENLGQVMIRLPRHNLDFFVNTRGQIESTSASGYTVDPDQDIGCLYGLDSYLVLRDSSPVNAFRKVLIPKGKVMARVAQRQQASIHVDSANSGGCFTYELDTLVGRLSGNRTMESDLFLVQLHGYTSLPVCDPLTGRTGTEEALDRLLSAGMRSFQEFPTDWRNQLDNIATLSPRRSYYPSWSKAMESVKWNTLIPVTSQHPAFEEEVARILEYWREIGLGQEQRLFRPRQNPQGMIELNLKALHRTFSQGVSGSLRRECAYDRPYVCRDSDKLSLQREGVAYRISYCAVHADVDLPICQNLVQLAENWHTIGAIRAWNWHHITEWFSAEAPDAWCTLYHRCQQDSGGSTNPRIALALSFIGYRRIIPLELVATLLIVAKNAGFPNIAIMDDLVMHKGSRFNPKELERPLKSYEIGFERSPEYDFQAPISHEQYDLKSRRYCSRCDSEIQEVIQELQEQWLEVPLVVHVWPKRRLRALSTLIQEQIQPLLQEWADNHRFLEHLGQVLDKCSKLHKNPFSPMEYEASTPDLPRRECQIEDVHLNSLLASRCLRMHPIGNLQLSVPIIESPNKLNSNHSNLNGLDEICNKLLQTSPGALEARYATDLKASLMAFQSTTPPATIIVPPTDWLAVYADDREKIHNYMLNQMQKCLSAEKTSDNLLQAVGLWPRITTKVMLRRLSLIEQRMTPSTWIEHIKQFAYQTTSVQQSRRLLRYAVLGQEEDYSREVRHSRNHGALSRHLDWVLLEIDSDICIRSTQIDIAEAMIRPKEGKNSVMQLNMGEGKSSIIAPSVAAALADTTKLVRMVVLKPQSKLMLQILRHRLSDLANRRIIYLPFFRGINISAGVTQHLLQNCRDDGGIWLCQPEHLLSFKLMGLDLAIRGESRGYELSRCQLWIHDNVRDILDESDEILHPRHQLVYTVGSQVPFDGAPDRWELVEAVLALLPDHLKTGIDEDYLISTPQSAAIYPQIRILSENGRQKLYQLAQRIIFEIPSLCLNRTPKVIQEAAVKFITCLNATSATAELRAYCATQNPSASPLWHSLLLLRGLFAHDILFTSFKQKRYRVDYGLDLGRSQLAVPYRAKDSPSLRSDFAHPDIAIVLTCVSYYYHGLTESMILQTLRSLFKSESPEQTYEEWIVCCRDNIPEALHTISGLALDDEQRMVTQLLKPLSHNKRVIDFYLNTTVFPKAAKEFPFKMSTSGWDIAMKKMHPVTGFSGTNDSRFLLPTSIVQRDDPAQLHTNATVLSHILRTENQTVISYPNNTSSDNLLDIIMGAPQLPTVLLDVGAQVLDRSNFKLVEAWLSRHKKGKTIKAAVYFDNDDNLRVLTHDGMVQSFLDSPFSNRLGECIVYLDDAHTRGTDLKLPKCRAAVTLGPRLSKDKLVQGCMRMRKLGSLHSLVFLAPNEVIQTIRECNKLKDDDPVTSFSVLFWSMKETCRHLQSDVALWAMQGHEFVRREANWEKFRNEMELDTNPSRDVVRGLFCQPDARKLEELYGSEKDDNWLEDYHTPHAASKISQEIFRHCENFDHLSFSNAGLKQEQEIELVNEKEEETQVQRPPPAKAAAHSLHPDVLKLVRTGHLRTGSPAFQSVEDSLQQTSLILPEGIDSMFSNIFLTRDFCRTILLDGVTSERAMDHFLRQVEWVVTINQRNPDSSSPVLVIFSPYEVNELLEDFRKLSHVRLHLFSARSSLSMKSLGDLTLFTLPSAPSAPLPRIPRQVQQQLDLFAGTLYLGDYNAYKQLCAALRVHLGALPDDMTLHGDVADIIDSNGFVKDDTARKILSLTGPGFVENPLLFLRGLLTIRRYGQGLGPSHLGKLLHGIELSERDDW